MMAYLKVEPTLRTLRRDARVTELLQRIGLEAGRPLTQTTQPGSARLARRVVEGR